MNYTSFELRLAKKYAEAFVKVFGSTLHISDYANLEAAQKTLSARRRTLFFLELPQFDSTIQNSMIEDLIGYFSLPQQFSSLLLLLVASNRSQYIPLILFFILQLCQKSNNIMHFSISSSHALDEKGIEQITLFLGHITKKRITCSYLVDKNLIAGIRAQSVEHMWEYSVRKHIAALRAFEK